MYYVGIDAGGTKTDFLLCDENENQIKKVTLGTGNPNDIGIDACIELLKKGLDELCGDLIPTAVFAGVSGGGYGENAKRIHSFLEEYFPNSKVDNGSDAMNIIHCSNSEGAVGALICGTGSVFFVRSEGEFYRFGGWGHLLEDGGSAYDIGREALQYLLDCEEHSLSHPSTPLYSALQKYLGSSAHDALTEIYAKGKSYIASLAPIVFEAYDMGDEAASLIIERNANAVIVRISLAMATCGKIDEIVCAGGLFNSSVFFDILSKKIKVPLARLSVSPVIGACRRAMKI